MKKFLPIALVGLTFAGFAQKAVNFTVSGTLKKVTGSYAYIHHKWDNKDITDSVKVKNGTINLL